MFTQNLSQRGLFLEFPGGRWQPCGWVSSCDLRGFGPWFPASVWLPWVTRPLSASSKENEMSRVISPRYTLDPERCLPVGAPVRSCWACRPRFTAVVSSLGAASAGEGAAGLVGVWSGSWAAGVVAGRSGVGQAAWAALEALPRGGASPLAGDVSHKRCLTRSHLVFTWSHLVNSNICFLFVFHLRVKIYFLVAVYLIKPLF